MMKYNIHANQLSSKGKMPVTMCHQFYQTMK